MKVDRPLVEVRNLVKHFPVHGGFLNREIARVHAVNDVSLDIDRGELLGVVGESGCGKSTLAKCLVRLLEPTSGEIQYDGHLIGYLEHAYMMPFRKRIQMIFQDPNSSLNPRYTANKMLREVIRYHAVVDNAEVNDYISELIETVGLHQDARYKYPHEFSGGQRQRLAIARALAAKPDFIVADETSVGPGRFGTGASSEPLARSQRSVFFDDDVHFSRLEGRQLFLRSAIGHVPGPDRRRTPLR